MNQTYDIFKKDGGNFLGSVEAENPKDAALQILTAPITTNRLNAQDQPDRIIKVDDNAFEISIAGEDYTIKVSDRTATQD